MERINLQTPEKLIPHLLQFNFLQINPEIKTDH